MSKHRRKEGRASGNNSHNMSGRNPMMNNPFGIDPKQLLGMLGGNMDMGRLNNMLSSMNRDGFDFSSIAQMTGMNNNGMGNNMNYNPNQQVNQNFNQQGQQQMGGGGFNFNNLMNMMNGMTNNPNNNVAFNGNTSDNNLNNTSSDGNENIKDDEEFKKNKSDKYNYIDNLDDIECDENILMLKSIKNIVNQSRGEFIDKVIKAYINGDFKD